MRAAAIFAERSLPAIRSRQVGRREEEDAAVQAEAAVEFDERAADDGVAQQEVVLARLAKAEVRAEPLDLLLELIARRAAELRLVGDLRPSRSPRSQAGVDWPFAPPTSCVQFLGRFAPARLRQFHLVRAAVAESLQERRSRSMRAAREVADRPARGPRPAAASRRGLSSPTATRARSSPSFGLSVSKASFHARSANTVGFRLSRAKSTSVVCIHGLELAHERRRVELRPVLRQRRLRGGDERRRDLLREPLARRSRPAFLVVFISR